MSYFLMEQGPLQEIEDVRQTKGKAIFKIIMQDADTVNQNGRIYPKVVLSEAMKNCEDRIMNRSFQCELDHPFPTNDDNFNMVRQTTVALKEVSHIIRDYEWQGNLLIGEFETLNTPNGRIAYSLIQDRVGLGTSMRGLAELESDGKHKIVKSPLMIICYDLVSRPSHKAAVIDERKVRFEAINPKLLTESANGKTICLPNGICYLTNYFDKLIEKKIIKLMKNNF